MYSPINYMKNYFYPDLVTNSVKTSKGKVSKEKANSSKSKKLILSRNDNIYINNLLMKIKTNNNNSYKQIFSTNSQLSSYDTPPNHKNKKDDLINNNLESLYKFFSPKLRENIIRNINNRKINHNSSNNNNFSFTKLEFNMSQIHNTNIQMKKTKSNNKYKGINEVNKTNKNYYKKILNFPLSQGNINVKFLKLHNINDLNEVASSFNFINKEKGNFGYKRIVSNKKLFNNKLSNNLKNKSTYDNKINSFICHNTNNININMNNINKRIIMNSLSNKDNNDSNYNNLLSFNKMSNSKKRYPWRNSKGTMTTTFKDISYNNGNNDIPEEIHFKAVKYIYELKYSDENFA